MKHCQKSVNRYREIFISLLKRSILTAAFVLIGLYLLRQGNILFFCLGFAAFIAAGVIIVALPLAALIAKPTGNLFWPSEYYDRPQPAYSIPQSKRAHGLYEEAMAGFEKIAEEYPEETQPYVEMIDIAIVNLHDPKRAKAIFLRGLSVLKKEEDQKTLERMYDAIKTRMNSRPARTPAESDAGSSRDEVSR